jgi:uncharacterized glyoxalase superfamily protein PhnB
MKSTPRGWPRISSCIYYQDPARAIDWLCRAFGFEVRLKVEDDNGRIEHSELVYGEGLIMCGGTKRDDPGKEAWQADQASPSELAGKSTQSLCVFVNSADEHCARARAAGAVIVREPTVSDYGPDYWADKSYGARDLEGHVWWFMERVREQPLPKQ